MFASRFLVLFDKSDGGSGGGGASGGKADDSSTPFTLEQQAAIGSMISGALKGEGKRLIGASVKDAIAELKLGDTIAAELAKLKPAEPPDPKPGEKKPDPEVAALKAKLDEVNSALKAQAEEAKSARESARDEKAQTALRSALTQHVRPDALEIAASHLFVAQKRVTFDDQGNPLFTVKRPAFAGGPEEEVQMPLADGVQHWIKSSEGKFFAPAPSAGGQAPPGGAPRRVNTGADGMPKYDAPATTDTERIRRAQEREAAVRQKYPHLT